MPMRGKTRRGRGPGLDELSSECRISGGDALLSEAKRKTGARLLQSCLGAGACSPLVGFEHVFDVALEQ